MAIRQLLVGGLIVVASSSGCGRVGFGLVSGSDTGIDAPDDVGVDAPPTDGASDARDTAADVPRRDGGDAATLNPVSVLTSGLSHTCAVALDTTYCWGSNASGQVGDGTRSDALSPVAVTGLPGTPSDIDCGHFHTCAIVGGAAWCWGRGGAGELGDGMERDSDAPVAVIGIADRVTDISGGQDFTCAIAGARAFCWGVDRAGSLGRAATGNSPVPVGVELDVDLVEVTSGQDHGCAITTDRTQAWCWGHNDNGALGNSSAGGTERTPVRVELPPAVTRIQEISIGGWHTCARTDQGLYCWGTGARGELGDGRLTASNVPVPVPAFPIAGSTTSLSVNGNPTFLDATCVVTDASEVHCWGVNTTGRMGDGTTMDRAVPTPVMGLTAERVATGIDHSCAVDAAGAVSCWGAGAAGQLGNGLGEDSLVATRVMGPWAGR